MTPSPRTLRDAERLVARYDVCGRRPTSQDSQALLTLLAKVLKIAKEPCERCAWIEKEYGSDVAV